MSDNTKALAQTIRNTLYNAFGRTLSDDEVMFISRHVGQLDRQIAALEQQVGRNPEVWAVVMLDYDDYPVRAPLSYHWTEADARAWIERTKPHWQRRAVQRVHVYGDIPNGGDQEGE